MATTDPRENVERAWEIVSDPTAYSKTEKRFLFERGLSHYQASYGLDEKTLLTDVSHFIGNALDEPSREEVLDDPYIELDKPGKLAILMSLGTNVLLRHPSIRRDPRDPKIPEYLRDYTLYHIYAATIHSPQREAIRIALGEVVYGRDQEDQYGPPVGRPVEGIVRLEGFDEMYFKIPLVHANRKCEARENHDRNGALRTVISGPYLYVPVDDIEKKYEDYYYGRGGVAYNLEDIVREHVKTRTLDTYQQAMKGVSERIDELIEIGKADKLFYEHQYPPRLKAILMAIEDADPEDAAFGEPLTSKEIANVVVRYHDKTEIDWVRKTLSKMGTPKSIGNQLSEYASDESIEHVTVEKGGPGEVNKYTLEYTIGDYKVVDVTEIEDLLELPCMRNIHELAMEENPNRWYLYSFVRVMLSLNTEFTVEDIKEWFSQYPWYDEEVTEYQVKYEKIQTMPDGREPQPVGCNNDNRNFERVCIGRENCEYSIYQSLNFKQSVYDNLEENEK